MPAPAGAKPTYCAGSAAPCVLPKVWPPAISATVSSSFIAMRANVSRMSTGRGERVGLAVRALRIHVNQSHLHGRERFFEIAFAGVALVVEPRVFRTPVNVLVGLPRVDATAGESERLESHRFQRAVSGQNHEVGPRDLAAVLLLDRPEQQARFVEVRVVGPTVERREALLARARAAAAVADAVRARAVPGHANEERSVVAVVGRPPVLRRGHQREEVGLDRLEVETVELAGVVEIGAHRVGERRRPVKRREVQQLGEPIDVDSRPQGYVSLPDMPWSASDISTIVFSIRATSPIR